MALVWPVSLLINKDLLGITESGWSWQEEKREFIEYLVLNNPHYFPQKRAIAGANIFRTARGNMLGCGWGL
jgi:hypothetical protein